MSHFKIALPLALSVALAPFAIDAYLPSFPTIAEAFGIPIHTVSLSISIYIFGLAFGQLIGGPLADRHGRQVVMLLGLSSFILTSLTITQVSHFEYFLALRAIQAFSGGWVMVCVPALVRDHTKGTESAKLFSLIGLMTIAAPAIAPSIGAYLMQWGWPVIFVFLSLYGMLALVFLKLTLFKNTNIFVNQRTKQHSSNQHTTTIINRYLDVLKTPNAMRYVFLQCMLFSVMMLFVTHASFVYQVHFRASSSTFSLLFAANIITMWLTMAANRFLLNHFQPHAILRLAIFIQAAAVLAMLMASILDLSIYFYASTLMLTVGMLGATSPNCQACYLEHFHQNSGTASAIMGSFQFGIAGIVSGLSTLLPEQLTSLAIAQLVCSFIALSIILWPTPKGKASVAANTQPR